MSFKINLVHAKLHMDLDWVCTFICAHTESNAVQKTALIHRDGHELQTFSSCHGSWPNHELFFSSL